MERCGKTQFLSCVCGKPSKVVYKGFFLTNDDNERLSFFRTEFGKYFFFSEKGQMVNIPGSVGHLYHLGLKHNSASAVWEQLETVRKQGGVVQ